MCSYHLAIFLCKDYKFLMKFLICFNFSVIFLAVLPLPLQKKNQRIFRNQPSPFLSYLCLTQGFHPSSIPHSTKYKQTNEKPYLTSSARTLILDFFLFFSAYILSTSSAIIDGSLAWGTTLWGGRVTLLSKGQHKKTFGFLKA